MMLFLNVASPFSQTPPPECIEEFSLIVLLVKVATPNTETAYPSEFLLIMLPLKFTGEPELHALAFTPPPEFLVMVLLTNVTLQAWA